MSEHQLFPAGPLNAAGLNRQHVFDLADLPAEMLSSLAPSDGERQLILLGHGGKDLWQCVKATGIGGENPIDDHCIRSVERWFTEQLPENHFRLLYPGEQALGLQQLGQLAGWHHPSPFMIGVDAEWGSWFAYRAVIVADTNFRPSPRREGNSPCTSCHDKPCINTCPAGALTGGRFALNTCVAYRKRADSACRETCLARLACPVGSEHRYDDAQLSHTYSISLRMIERNF
jgi:epoxyqueuosine reductase